MDSNGLWFKRSSGNLPLPPSGCGTMEASAMIPTTKSNRPGIHANANRRPTYERSSRQASMRWGARWARERGYSAPRPRFLPSRGSGALRVPRGPQREASLAATNVPSSPPALANSRFPATKNSPDTRPKCAKNSSIKGQPSRACGETGTTIRAIDAFLTLAVYEVRPG